MATYTNHTDLSLIEAIKNNDEQAFEELVLRYWKRSHTNAYARVNSHEVAQEIAQDVFMSLWDKRATNCISNVSSYIYACIKNKSINYIESKILQQKYWDHYKKFVPQSESLTDHTVDYLSLQEAIDEGITHLPKKSKKIFRLSRIEGHTIPEIASILNLSEKAIEYHLTKSLKQLRIHLKDFITIISFLFYF